MNTRICGSLGDKLYSRGFGKRIKRCIELSWVEMAYLCEKNLLDFEFSEVVKEASKNLVDFDVQYLVYRDLRDRGYVLNVHPDYFFGKKNYSMKFYPVSDMDYFYSDEFLDREYPLMLSVVDSDGEVTYYMVDIIRPVGNYFVFPERKIHVELYGKRVFSFSPIDDFEMKSYGKNEGKWAHLNILEGKYLWEKGVISKSPRVNKRLYHVYKDLRDHGLIVKSGFKYGTHFRVYENSINEHSKYLVHSILKKEEIQKISRAVRVAHGVKKNLLLAYIYNGNVIYFKFSWVRP